MLFNAESFIDACWRAFLSKGSQDYLVELAGSVNSLIKQDLSWSAIVVN